MIVFFKSTEDSPWRTGASQLFELALLDFFLKMLYYALVREGLLQSGRRLRADC